MNASQNIKHKLQELHRTLIEGLVTILKDPELASAADRKLAWEILKDNGVQLEDLRTDCVARLEPLVKRMPFTDDVGPAESEAA